MLRRLAPLLALLALGGCASTGDDRPNMVAGLVLDTAPAAVHVGIYVAVSRGFDEADGVTLRIREPATPRSGLDALRRGRTPFAVLDVHDLAVARERGQDVVAVMAIAQLPIEARARRALRDQGRAALARSIDLESAPRYPELVLATTSVELRDEPALVRATVAAISRGYQEELTDPEPALQVLLENVKPAARRAEVSADLPRIEATFTGTTGKVGAFDPAQLRLWAAWEAKTGIVKTPPDLRATFPPIPPR